MEITVVHLCVFVLVIEVAVMPVQAGLVLVDAAAGEEESV